MNRKTKLLLFTAIVAGWITLAPSNHANADEYIQADSITPDPTPIDPIQTVSDQLNNDQSTLSSAVNSATGYQKSQNSVVISDAQSAINDAVVATQVAQMASNDLYIISEVVGNANNELTIAQNSLSSVNANIVNQEGIISNATSNISTISSDISIINQAIIDQNVVVSMAQDDVYNDQLVIANDTAAIPVLEQQIADATAAKAAADAIVAANTTPGLAMTVYSNPGTGGSPAMGGNVVYTGTDTNGINEQWGSSGPTVNGGTTTVTETFAGNHLNTTIGITVNGTSVSTTNNNNVYIGSIGFPAPGQDPSLSLRTPTAPTVITMPTNTISASFDVFAKNGNSTATVTYTDGTTDTFVIQDDVNPNYPGYVHQEIITAPSGKKISTITIPTDWDYYGIDNVSATQQATTTVSDDFQVKWTGTWTPQYTGTQWLTAPADDGVKLYLDGQLVINDWYDKGGGGSTATVSTTAGVGKTFEMWYYENGGGANVALKRYTGSGWEIVPASEFTQSSATAGQIAAAQLATAELNSLIQGKNITLQELSNAQGYLITNQANLDIQQSILSNLTEQQLVLTGQLASAQNTLNDASISLSALQSEKAIVESLIIDKQNAVQSANQNFNTATETYNVSIATAQSLTAIATDKVNLAVTAIATTPSAPRSTYTAPSTVVQTPPDQTIPPIDSGTTTEPTGNADGGTTTDTPSTDTGQGQDSQQSSNQSQNSGTSTPSVSDTKITSADALPTDVPLLPPKEILVAHVQEDKAGVLNGGIEFFGTKDSPQVVGEDGKLTPPAPPPGSGLPIPPDAITTQDTFIGQPGGTTFNAPDIAVPVKMTYVCHTVVKDSGETVHIDVNNNEHPIEQCTFLPAALDAIPGAGQAIQAVGAAYTAMANIGNDMSPVTRKKAKKILVTTVVIGQIAGLRRRFGQ